MIGPSMKCKPAIFLLLLCGALFAVLAVPSVAQAPAKCKLTVKVTGIRNANGNILIGLRRDANTVVDSKVVQIDAKSMTAEAVFENLPEGTYGVGVIHDENKNGSLDFDAMGTPTEGYGHSNNPERRMGPPNFDETKFPLTQAGATIEIKLIYWQ